MSFLVKVSRNSFFYILVIQRMLLDYYGLCTIFMCYLDLICPHCLCFLDINIFLFNKTSLHDETLGILFNLLSFRLACVSFLVSSWYVKSTSLVGLPAHHRFPISQIPQ
jgi:hypothetical protein